MSQLNTAWGYGPSYEQLLQLVKQSFENAMNDQVVVCIEIAVQALHGRLPTDTQASKYKLASIKADQLCDRVEDLQDVTGGQYANH